MPTKASKTTTDHEEIRRWAEERNEHPATVKRTAKGGGAGILRIDFPGYSGEESLKEISWDKFFEKLERLESRVHLPGQNGEWPNQPLRQIRQS